MTTDGYTALFLGLLFVFGTVFGSFTSVLAYRIPNGRSVSKGRSKCPHCSHILSGIELIPVFSYLIQAGKCRNCRASIHVQYPLLEISVGLLFAAAYFIATQAVAGPSLLLVNTDSISLLFWLTLAFLLAIIVIYTALFLIDLHHLLLPDVLVFTGIGIAIVYHILKILLFLSQGVASNTAFVPFLQSLGIGLLVAGFFLFLIIITRGKGMGGGDVKLAVLIGLVNGWPQTIVAIFIAFLSGAIISSVLLLVGKKRMTSVVPFGPFLIAGSVIALLYGNRLVDFYINGVLG